MGHKNLIDGVGRDTTAGRCLVDGVGYSVQKGRTLVDGTGYDVAIASDTVLVSLKGIGSTSYANAGTVTINGITYNRNSAPVTIEVEVGTVVSCRALYPVSLGFTEAYEAAKITLNGKSVKSSYSSNVTYDYTVATDVEITLGLYNNHGEVRIVEL